MSLRGEPYPPKQSPTQCGDCFAKSARNDIDFLTLKGETRQEEEKKGKAWHMREQRWGAFERAVALPTEVVADKAKAEFENGILTITLPKAEEVKPKIISIKAK